MRKMEELTICQHCSIRCGGTCAAVVHLLKIYEERRRKDKFRLIYELRNLLDYPDCYPSEDLEALGIAVIRKVPELSYISELDVQIGYVESYERKIKNGELVLAETKKVVGQYRAYLPFDFVITFYLPNVAYLTDNQKKIVMWHELRHIQRSSKGLILIPHEVKDFKSILSQFGLDYLDPDHEVPDILA